MAKLSELFVHIKKYRNCKYCMTICKIISFAYMEVLRKYSIFCTWLTDIIVINTIVNNKVKWTVILSPFVDSTFEEVDDCVKIGIYWLFPTRHKQSKG